MEHNIFSFHTQPGLQAVVASWCLRFDIPFRINTLAGCQDELPGYALLPFLNAATTPIQRRQCRETQP